MKTITVSTMSKGRRRWLGTLALWDLLVGVTQWQDGVFGAIGWMLLGLFFAWDAWLGVEVLPGAPRSSIHQPGDPE